MSPSYAVVSRNSKSQHHRPKQPTHQTTMANRYEPMRLSHNFNDTTTYSGNERSCGEQSARYSSSDSGFDQLSSRYLSNVDSPKTSLLPTQSQSGNCSQQQQQQQPLLPRKGSSSNAPAPNSASPSRSPSRTSPRELLAAGGAAMLKLPSRLHSAAMSPSSQPAETAITSPRNNNYGDNGDLGVPHMLSGGATWGPSYSTSSMPRGGGPGLARGATVSGVGCRRTSWRQHLFQKIVAPTQSLNQAGNRGRRQLSLASNIFDSESRDQSPMSLFSSTKLLNNNDPSHNSKTRLPLSARHHRSPYEHDKPKAQRLATAPCRFSHDVPCLVETPEVDESKHEDETSNEAAGDRILTSVPCSVDPKPVGIVQREDLLSAQKDIAPSPTTGQSSKFFRTLWRKAISEQILILRMNKQKQRLHKLRKTDEAIALERSKLEYDEITPCPAEQSTQIWEAMIRETANDARLKLDYERLADAVKSGIPRQLRSRAWLILAKQCELRESAQSRRHHTAAVRPYVFHDLLTELTSYQHAILIDLGRTFPSHPYFAQQFGPGQLSLFNVLKAYSLYDTEVGYCQGLSFVAGILLLHAAEEEAFNLLIVLMYKLGLRHQYRPDMLSMQVQMYQMSRLLRDYHPDLYEHLETHEVPTLYAAPWFLTLFASTFPLGFVARVFDLVFLSGSLDVVFSIAIILLDLVFLSGSLDVVFSIAIILLGNHKELIKHCASFETINDFLKLTLPSMSIIQMERIFNQVFELDISRDLLSYAVEYQVLQEELVAAPDLPDIYQLSPTDQVQRLDALNRNLRKQNMELLEQLRESHSKFCFAEKARKDLEESLSSAHNTIDSYKCKVTELNNRLNILEFEHKSLLAVVSKMPNFHS